MHFCTKIYESIKNYFQHGEKQPRQEVEYAYIIEHLLYQTIRPITFFGALSLLENHNFPFKVCNTALSMQRFYFRLFLLGGFKVNYPANMKNYFSCIFSGYVHVP